MNRVEIFNSRSIRNQAMKEKHAFRRSMVINFIDLTLKIGVQSNGK